MTVILWARIQPYGSWLIKENLPKVITNPKNGKARNQLQTAATMAGWAFTVAQVGLAHAMAHTVGILYNVPHGAACGIVLPAVMRFNVDFAADKLAMVAQAMGVNIAGMDNKKAALAAADAVEKLMKETGHPMRLRDVGVPQDGRGIADGIPCHLRYRGPFQRPARFRSRGSGGTV